MFCRPDGPLAVGRNLDVFTILPFATQIAQQARLAAFNVGGPDLLLRRFEFAGGIGYLSFTAEFRATGKDGGLAIGSQAQAENLLAVITLIVSHLPRLELWGIGDPYVALTPQIKNPGN